MKELREHIELAVVTECGIDAGNIIVGFPESKIDYAMNRSKNCLGTEILKAGISITTDEPIDRRQILKALRRQKITLSRGLSIMQEVESFEMREYVEPVGGHETIIKVKYTHEIKE